MTYTIHTSKGEYSYDNKDDCMSKIEMLLMYCDNFDLDDAMNTQDLDAIAAWARQHVDDKFDITKSDNL